MASARDIIRKIELHEALKYWVMQELEKEGIACEERDFYDEKGDIYIVNLDDVPRSLEIVQRIKDENS